ncbi:hypothetical protein MJO28_005006 [Puccinia striiformis f. sp. tritici]|uniref:Uncharacterized protein n=1 Tax=Puccinia striiformis f. sp. tritici TaxID=168172 RepID=A0ACC0EL15_9BASI|nr:hypothetical protein MJO28_005006 [Puccinia striiformis f. sp. tritici]
MVNLSKRLFCCLALHALGGGQLAGSLPNADGPLAKEFYGMLQGTHRPETNAVVGMDASVESTEHGNLNPGMPLAELNANKATIESIKTDRQEIRRLLTSLYAGNTPKFLELKSQLERLHKDLGAPIMERVLGLNGIGSWMNPLQAASKNEPDQRSLEVQNKSGRLYHFLLGLVPKRERRPNTRGSAEPTASGHSLSKSNVASDSSSESLPQILSTQPTRPGTVTSTSETLTGAKQVPIRNHADGRSTRANVVLHGDALDVLRGHVFKEEIENWHALKKALVELPTQPNFGYSDFIEGTFRLQFLKCLYLIEQLIHKYDLLPKHLIGDVDLFEPTTLLKMIEYHTELLFKRNYNGFFGVPDSIIPQLEFLKTARAVQHFHSPLTALSAANQRYAVYLVLRVIIRHAPWRLYWFWETVRSSDRFKEICKLFNQDDFFQKVNSLSDALSKTPHQNHLSHDKSLPVVLLVNDALDFFQRPSLLKGTDFDRLEFLVTYYILDFLDQFYRPILTEILRSRSHSELFDKQLHFMRGNLKFYQNRVEDPKYPDERQDMTFLETYKDSFHEDSRLHGWIEEVANNLMQQNLSEPGKKPFTLWMDRHCYHCLFPLGKCYRYCGL